MVKKGGKKGKAKPKTIGKKFKLSKATSKALESSYFGTGLKKPLTEAQKFKKGL